MTPQIYKVHLHDERSYYVAALTPIDAEKIMCDVVGKNLICCITPRGAFVCGPQMVKGVKVNEIG